MKHKLAVVKTSTTTPYDKHRMKPDSNNFVFFFVANVDKPDKGEEKNKNASSFWMIRK